VNPESVPSLSQVLLRFAPWTLLQAIVRLKEKIPIKRAISMLTRSSSSSLSSLKRPADPVELEYSLVLECYLESVLAERRCDTSILPSILTNKLASVYLSHVKYNSGGAYPDSSKLPPLPESIRNFNEQFVHYYSQEWKQKHKSFFFNNSRIRWLDELPPFSGSGSPSSSTSPDFDKPHFYVEKLQALLCSDCPRDDSAILQLIMEGGPYPSKLSLLLLVMPSFNRIEDAIKMLVEPHPSVALDYGKRYCTKVCETDLSFFLSLSLSPPSLSPFHSSFILTCCSSFL
jgi:hypothetical protein